MRPKRQTRETELGPEIQCVKCQEFWPADREFFYMSKGKPHSWCRACYDASPSARGRRENWNAKIKAQRAAAKEGAAA